MSRAHEAPESTDAPPSLLDEPYRTAYLDDEAYAASPEPGSRPRWLRTDYRQFIDHTAKAQNLSLRNLAHLLKMKSATSVSYLVKPKFDGKRLRVTCPSGPQLAQLAHVLQLPAEEHRLLRLLVNLEASRRSGHGDPALFTRLIEQAWMLDTGYLPHAKALGYARDFLNIALREMVGLTGFRPDPEWLRNHLLYPLGRPPTTGEIERCWRRLVDLGVVQAGPDDGWRRGPADVIIGAGHPDRSDAIKDFFEVTLRAAAEALALASHQRRFEARTVSLSRSELARITEQFDQLLDGIDESPDGTGDVVMQVMLLAFPIADVRGRPQSEV